MVNVVSRRQENQADAFAAELGYGKELKTALVKLNVENASTLKVHWLVSMLRNRWELERNSEVVIRRCWRGANIFRK